jgi:hypothetical protein
LYVQKDVPFSNKVAQVIDAVFHFIEEYREIQALMYAIIFSTITSAIAGITDSLEGKYK